MGLELYKTLVSIKVACGGCSSLDGLLQCTQQAHGHHRLHLQPEPAVSKLVTRVFPVHNTVTSFGRGQGSTHVLKPLCCSCNSSRVLQAVPGFTSI